ncbi:MAG: DNA polymerase III subunit epsilon [Rhodoferax sp.]|nr:DNA polymerase III subunit epsilon [Rhodoferax sp.]
MRLVFIETETTGISPLHGHRIIEIAGVEMVDGRITGREFHRLINPQRSVPQEAVDIHGIDDAMLQGKPFFHEVLMDLIPFLAGGRTVIHSAPFDIAFFDAELAPMGLRIPGLSSSEVVIDTLPLFRKLHPGQPCSLTALCERYGLQPQGDEGWDSAMTDARLVARLWVAAGFVV